MVDCVEWPLLLCFGMIERGGGREFVVESAAAAPGPLCSKTYCFGVGDRGVFRGTFHVTVFFFAVLITECSVKCVVV